MIYELITLSDPITFKTDCDKIAFLCSLILGDGKAGCHRYDENGSQIDIPSLLLFKKNADEFIMNYLGMSMDEFFKKNTKKIKECFSSFCYGSIKDREIYDSTIKILSDDEKKLNEFKKIHEDKNRSSMNQWVKTAWEYSKKLKDE
jgi:hypothetical protein